ncbi:glycerol-3-phosphate 1-O-acyltransferase PlsY [Negativicoccus succinicivorans]|uniref:glycerol-3-phosphate 1-O-acyltransferase PlsY n=1 Tax=Negativicoccus succinicivorans TaxID=620903 RepID=UPI00290A46B1|nr:glycerol-3-phosphate 1-O-acyltransferase PlsY [Negativicoccus succinicivorans]MDU5530221.1 glycerol-3-phosphate 1-O-acyltransferase PlsY [Negativicoccus succinicivorans]
MINYLLCVMGAYLLGSIPSGLWLGKLLCGTDLRRHGSRNIGATNAYRTLGARMGIAVFAADFLKGVAATSLGGNDPILLALCAAAAIVGHCFSVFLGFRGGRGVATGFGVMCCLSLPVAVAAAVVWAVLVFATRLVSLASIVAALTVPILLWWWQAPSAFLIFATLGAIAIIFQHRANIGRLLRGEEKQIERAKLKRRRKTK